MSRYWFKRRRYGYGLTPASREGWLTMGVYLAAAFGGAMAVGAFTPTPLGRSVFIYFVLVLVLTVAVIGIAIRKGPQPRWRWGRQPSDNPDEDI